MKMLIGGKPADASDKGTIDVVNPATLKVIDTVPAATKEDIDRAVSCAVEGRDVWAGTPLYKRIDILKRFVELYKEHKQELIDALVAEVGKPVNQATGCVNGTVELIEEYIEQARCLCTDTLAVAPRADVAQNLTITVREPLGIVVSILPFNYPIDVITHEVIPALLMGNAVIAKPASETPFANLRYVELLLESGVPGNAVQAVTGSGSKVGKWLAEDPRIDVITMTGSTEVGAEIARNAAPHMHHLHLELGGNSPYIILEDADLEYAVAESVFGRTLNSGQVCSACKRFIVHNSIKKRYLELLIESLKSKKVGDPASTSTDCGPLVSVRAAKEVEAQIGRAVQQGGELLYGGKRFGESYIELTVIDTPPTADIARDEEIFGPVWTVIGFDTVDEAIAIANDSKYGLSSGVSGKDVRVLMQVAKAMQAGDCVINGSACYRSVDMPFGGFKKSGLGRAGGKFSLEEMSQLKTIIFKNCY